ncbi:hypothetical protein [Proteus vulgaris]|nr:hypothetical protein [Proteus vulgaris]
MRSSPQFITFCNNPAKGLNAAKLIDTVFCSDGGFEYTETVTGDLAEAFI